MIKPIVSAALIFALTMSHAFAEGDVKAGEAKSQVCAACHGPDGNSVNPEWPKLAGQHAGYTETQLKHFKEGARNNVLMNAQAVGLTEQDMQDLAAFYASQAVTPGETDPSLLRVGEKLYRGGDVERNITACIACHGPKGEGNPAADMPLIGGQHATYTVSALTAYADGDRPAGLNQMMQNIAILLTDKDKEALASYIEGLY